MNRITKYFKRSSKYDLQVDVPPAIEHPVYLIATPIGFLDDNGAFHPTNSLEETRSDVPYQSAPVSPPRAAHIVKPSSNRKRKKYAKYSLTEKRRILEEAELCGYRAVSDKLCIPQSTISTWKKAMADTPESDEEGKKKKCRKVTYRKPGGGRKLSYSIETDQKILSWVLRRRDLQLPVSQMTLEAYATKLILDENPNFKASRGWLQKFMRRNNLSTRCKTSLSQKMPADLEQRLLIFYQHLKEIRADEEFDDAMIINMDEVPMYFDLVPRRTINVKGKKDVRIITTGGEKRHFTVVLAVTASGVKLPPMLIFKGKRPLKITPPKGWIITVNPTAWMTEDLMAEWLTHIVKPHTERRPSLLVMDSFAAHNTETIEAACKKLHCTTAIIPGGCTPRAQPLDVCLNKPFKDSIRQLWAASISEKVTETNRAPKTTKEEIVQWVESAWGTLNPELVKKSFKVTGISTALDGTEDHIRGNEMHIAAHLPDVDDDDSDDEEDFLGFSLEDVPDHDDPFRDLSSGTDSDSEDSD